jgi:4-oxalocrotonate tautomerase
MPSMSNDRYMSSLAQRQRLGRRSTTHRRFVMPLVRISLATGHASSQIATISKGVHRAMVDTFNVPVDDVFQVITEHMPATGLAITPAFLGVEHTANAVFVQITCSDGRSIEQKKALYAKIADNVAEGGVRREDVIINLVETKRENWSFGIGLAQYA